MIHKMSDDRMNTMSFGGHKPKIKVTVGKSTNSLLKMIEIKLFVLCFYAPFEKGGAYCFAHVGRYVGIP